VSGLLDALAGALSASPGLALAGAVGWGVASVLLSPCHLAGVPLVVGYVSGTEARTSARRSAVLSLVFAFGVLLTIAALGVATTAAGRAAGDLGPWAAYAGAAVLMLMGLYLLDVVRLPDLPTWGGGKGRGGGAGAALLLGLAFGTALGPCTFAFLAPVLGAGLAVAGERPALALGLVAAFGLGHAGVLVVAGGSVGLADGLVSWSARSRLSGALRGGSGVLVILGGLYLLFTA
jgi:cytochrome c-type biogenesis protein